MLRTILVITIAVAASVVTTPIATAQSTGPPLLAGVAAADITPASGLMLWGYSNRTHAATGKLDPLMAAALVLQQGNTSAAIVTLDLGRTPENRLLDALRTECQERHGVGFLFITASHTHSAPSLESTDGPNTYGPQVIAAISKLVGQAAASISPVKLRVGGGEADFAHNRRRHLPDGRVAMQWRNAEREPTEPVDRTFAVLRFDRADGTPLAVLLHYACHPVVLGPDNYEYSADYVGQMRALVEEQLKTTCLFLQGACGDLNPYVDKTPLAEGGVEEMRRMGRGLAHLVVDAAQAAKPLEGASSLKVQQRSVSVRLRWNLADPQVRALLSAKYGRRFDNYLAKQLAGDSIAAPLTTIVVGERVAIVGMPGEIFVDFQLDLRRRSPVRDTLLVGYTNGYHAYFPTIREAAAGGYGGKTATYVAPGAGELLTNEALVSLYTLLGRLHDKPRAEDFDLLEWDDVKRGS